MSQQQLTVFSTTIRQNGGLYSLNDLHKAAGGEKKHAPNELTADEYVTTNTSEEQKARKEPISPTFDCSKAKSEAEKLICSYSDLAELDSITHEVYKIAKEKAPDTEGFLKESRKAWQWREDNCRDKECLEEWFIERLHAYSDLAEAMSQDKTAPKAQVRQKQPVADKPKEDEKTSEGHSGKLIAFRQTDKMATLLWDEPCDIGIDRDDAMRYARATFWVYTSGYRNIENEMRTCLFARSITRSADCTATLSRGFSPSPVRGCWVLTPLDKTGVAVCNEDALGKYGFTCKAYPRSRFSGKDGDPIWPKWS